MHYAILAAGQGSRLKNEGILRSKPLVTLGSQTLLERLYQILSSRPDCSSTSVIVNTSTAAEAERLGPSSGLRHFDHILVRDTAGSMDSLTALAPLLRRLAIDGDSRFCLMTADSVWLPEEFDSFIAASRSGEADGYMAVTSYVDDESPLYVSTDPEERITGFHDTPPQGWRYVSGGIYLLPMSALDILDTCRSRGLHRMRDFQRALLQHSLRLKAIPFSRIIDIDHASDLEAARLLLHL